MALPSPSRSALLDFLDQPAITIRVAERHVTVVVGPFGFEAGCLSLRPEVKRFAHFHSTPDFFLSKPLKQTQLRRYLHLFLDEACDFWVSRCFSVVGLFFLPKNAHTGSSYRS